MKLSIIIPSYNEEKIIFDTLKEIHAYLNLYYKGEWEILCVDDCSTDNTYNNMLRYIDWSKSLMHIRPYHNMRNMGKGYSVRLGMMCADGDYVLVTDADLSTPITELPCMLKCMEKEKSDFVAGSRYCSGALIDKKQSLLRRFYSSGYNLFVRCLFGLKVKDSQNGFKLFTHNAVEKILRYNRINRYAFDIELFAICKENNLAYAECPVYWSDNKVQSWKLKFIFEMFLDTLRVKYNQVKGRYSYADRRQ